MSKSSHIQSQGHKNALQALANKNSRLPQDLPERPPQAVPLSFVDMLGPRPKPPPEPSCRPPSPVENPFSDIMLYDDGFFDNTGQRIKFSAGHLPDHDMLARTEVQQRIDRLSLLPNHSIFGQFSDELEDEPDSEATVDGAFAAAMRRMGMDDESDEEGEDDFGFARVDEDEAWFPHGSRTMFMLDLLDNLPRLRLSDDHLKSIIWVMRECRTPNVPSFSALRKKQESLTRTAGIPSQHHTSSLGNHFYMNHPAKLFALDWANPLVRPFIHVYPEVMGPISEFWQSDKWTTEIDLDELSPMWANWENRSKSHRHFYIKELAQLCDGTFVVPLRWITVNNVVHADVHDAEYVQTEQGAHFRLKPGFRRILASNLLSNYLDLCTSFNITFTDYHPNYPMPHPLREKARRRPMFRLRIMPWSDDVSGNVSKQYNAHTNMYVTNLNLPHQKLQQEYFVRFASTSPHASSSEQFVALSEDCIPGVWHEAYDCESEQEILFEIIPHVLPADNPQQSETSSHIGMAGNFGCRHDLTGGTKEYRETDEGYSALYAPGERRQTNVWMACLGDQTTLDMLYKSTGVKDKIAQYWIAQLLDKAKVAHQEKLSNRDTRDPELNNPNCKGLARSTLKERIKNRIQRDLWDWVVQQPNEFILLPENDPFRLRLDLKPGIHYNVLLQTRGIDPHRDTPGEILHTYLLGNNKYVWHDSTKNWDDKKGDLFASRLQASCLNSLSIPPPRARYVVQYKNSLIGKHFKMLQQLGIFHLHDLCSPLLFDLWKATGELGALLWFPEIKNMDIYLADLNILINNVLDIWGLIDPNRILVKGKLHVLTHLVDDVRRFGPSVIYATEIQECWNAIFRLCSIFSNHLSPSRDIARTLADMERFKHMVSGGWWKDSKGKFVRAGSSVRSFLVSNSQLQRRLGWSEKNTVESGTVKLETLVKRHPKVWNMTSPEPAPVGSTWVNCKSVIAQSGDACKPGFWIFVQTGKESEPFVGRITKILARDGSTLKQHGNVVVDVDPFIILDVKDQRLNMPILVQSMEASNVNVHPEHDCVFCKCKAASVFVRQERIFTDLTELEISHSPEQCFILNMHALHNAHLIRDILPRSLTEPIPYLQDRAASHGRFAAQLQETGPAKRAETQAKTKATREKNKQKGIVLASAQAQRQQDEQGHGEDSDMLVVEHNSDVIFLG
ncbi:hypothetical protein B0H13DRAFT_1913006 [Mycena leptocephala]|nr:hypothetical protein B0H13DRAFT_1913006 [Mycena leptocephala]